MSRQGSKCYCVFIVPFLGSLIEIRWFFVFLLESVQTKIFIHTEAQSELLSCMHRTARLMHLVLGSIIAVICQLSIDNIFKQLRTTSVAEMRNESYALLRESIKSMNHEW